MSRRVFTDANGFGLKVWPDEDRDLWLALLGQDGFSVGSFGGPEAKIEVRNPGRDPHTEALYRHLKNLLTLPGTDLPHQPPATPQSRVLKLLMLAGVLEVTVNDAEASATAIVGSRNGRFTVPRVGTAEEQALYAWFAELLQLDLSALQ